MPSGSTCPRPHLHKAGDASHFALAGVAEVHAAGLKVICRGRRPKQRRGPGHRGAPARRRLLRCAGPGRVGLLCGALPRQPLHGRAHVACRRRCSCGCGGVPGRALDLGTGGLVLLPPRPRECIPRLLRCFFPWAGCTLLGDGCRASRTRPGAALDASEPAFAAGRRRGEALPELARRLGVLKVEAGGPCCRLRCWSRCPCRTAAIAAALLLLLHHMLFTFHLANPARAVILAICGKPAWRGPPAAGPAAMHRRLACRQGLVAASCSLQRLLLCTSVSSLPFRLDGRCCCL